MSEIKLLPCPFCGGEAHTKECMGLENKSYYYVECGGIECDVIPTTAMCDSLEEAIKQWNTRKPMERIIEQLEQNLEECKKYIREYDDSISQKAFHQGILESLRVVKEEGGIDVL